MNLSLDICKEVTQGNGVKYKFLKSNKTVGENPQMTRKFFTEIFILKQVKYKREAF